MTELEKQYATVGEATKRLRLLWAEQIVDGHFLDASLQAEVSAKASALADLLLEMNHMVINEQLKAQD